MILSSILSVETEFLKAQRNVMIQVNQKIEVAMRIVQALFLDIYA